MSPGAWSASAWGRSFPRVSGDEPIIVEHDVALAEFSPRERG